MTVQSKKKNSVRALAAVCAAFLFLTTFQNAGIKAQTLAEQLSPDADYGVKFDYAVNDNYLSQLKEYEKNGYQPADIKEPIKIEAASFSASGKTPQISEENGKRFLYWEENNDYLEWKVSVPSTGLYSIKVTYKADEENGTTITRALQIDGKTPFEECASIPFYRLWKDNGKPVVNNIGDEVRPGVEQVLEWQTVPLYDTNGMYDDALQFYLTAGEHTIRLAMVDEPLLLESLALYAPVSLKPYAEKKKEWEEKEKQIPKKPIIFEAEDEHVLHKNSSTLRMGNDGDPLTSPQKTGSVVMNILGGTNWQDGNSSVTWKFHVEEAGMYQLALRLRQNYREGLPSYRRIEIDGEVPFCEWNSYKISYDKKWRTEVIADEKGQPYTVFLDQGDHTLTMSVKQGELREISEIVKADSLRLSELLMKITMITGQTPDLNYDYELDTKIPGLLDTLQSIADNMKICMDKMEKASGNRPSKYYQMEGMISQIEKLIEYPFIIPRNLEDLKTTLTSYGDWIIQFAQHPLILDNIQWHPANAPVENKQSNFFQIFVVSCVNFFNSFVKDYDSILSTSGDYEVKSIIDVWIGRGKDWGMLLKQMADEDFTPKTGIGIRLNILPASQLNAGSVNALMLAIASGRAPDVGLATATGSVGEFALRNAVADLSEMEGFEQVKKQFLDALFIPMTHKGGVYGLPETMRFTAMVYRKDILSQLGVSLPKTWDELYDKIIPVLYQNNMQFYMPGANQTEVENGYTMFLYQLGGKLYSDDLMTSALDTPQAFQAFKEYTELFTLYGVPVTANFFNRFRTGETPIGISDFTAYMQILAAAPELNGKWGIAPIPGHKGKDGTIDRTHTGVLAESAIILSQSDQQPEAWEFLKWWTGTDVQRQYGNEIEALQGKSARWNTANMTAFESMAWPREDLIEIQKTFEQVDQVPVLLGGYFSGRHINNAFNRVVVSGMNLRDSLETAVKDINRELKRRRDSTAAGQTEQANR